MATIGRRFPIHPLHGILLGFPPSLFISALLSDITYLRTSEIQWSNFAQWLIAGGLLAGGITLVSAVFLVLRLRAGRRARPLTYLAPLAAMWIIALVNMLLHSRDAWYSVTATGLFLSVLTAVLALAAAWLGYSGFEREETL